MAEFLSTPSPFSALVPTGFLLGIVGTASPTPSCCTRRSEAPTCTHSHPEAMVSVVRPSRGGGAGFCSGFCSGLTIIKLCWAAAAILLVAMHRHFLSSSSTGETYYSDADDASASSNAESAYSDASKSGNEMSAFKEKNRKFHEKKRTPPENVVPVPYGTAPASAAAPPPPPPAKEATADNNNDSDWCSQAISTRSCTSPCHATR